MNILGWLITLTLMTTTIVRLSERAHTCSCAPWHLHLVDPTLHTCRDGQRYHKSDRMTNNPIGTCVGGPKEYFDAFWACVSAVNCVDYLAMIAVALSIASLPFLVVHARRVVLHSLLNLFYVKGGVVLMTGRVELCMAVLTLVGTFLVQWDLGNGEGFLGPLTRYRKRDSNGRYV